MPAKAVDVETYSHLDPDSSTQASTCPPSSKDRRNRYEKRSTSAVPIIQPFRIHLILICDRTIFKMNDIGTAVQYQLQVMRDHINRDSGIPHLS